MKNEHPIKKKPEPIPHDPRNEPIPEPDENKGSRSAEEAERKARKEEGLDMKGAQNVLPTGVDAHRSEKGKGVTEDEYGLPTGIPKSSSTPASPSTDVSDQRKSGRPGKPESGTLDTDQQLAGIIPLL